MHCYFGAEPRSVEPYILEEEHVFYEVDTRFMRRDSIVDAYMTLLKGPRWIAGE
jgi:hypothetical protein